MRAWALFCLFFVGCGAAQTRPGPDGLGEARVALLREDLTRARPTVPVEAPTETACAPLPIETWSTDPMLVISEATTCRYRVTWNGWSPPRDYDYVPDAEGWIADYFISGHHGWVWWNLRTGDVVVRPVDQMPLDAAGALVVAGWARATNFPGLDVARVTFVPTVGRGPHSE